MITKKDIIQNIFEAQYRWDQKFLKSERDKKLMSVVMNEYFKIVQKEVLKGNIWFLPPYTEFKITKTKIKTLHQRKPINRNLYAPKRIILSKRLFNKRTIDTIFRIKLINHSFELEKCRFRAAHGWRMKLNKILLEKGDLK